jgi:hypothetical protein
MRTVVLAVGCAPGLFLLATGQALAAEITENPASLTFQPNATALYPQTVTVTGADDALVGGTVAYTIVTAAATSGDPAYQGLNPADVSVSTQVNDVAYSTPRPNVQIIITRGTTGVLNVTVQAGQGSISKIGFGSPRASENGRVRVAGGPQNQTGAFAFTPTNSPTTAQVTVQSPDRSKATTVYMIVTDTSGAWNTFVGGDAGSF